MKSYWLKDESDVANFINLDKRTSERIFKLYENLFCKSSTEYNNSRDNWFAVKTNKEDNCFKNPPSSS